MELGGGGRGKENAIALTRSKYIASVQVDGYNERC
jgi:hypothetical protein